MASDTTTPKATTDAPLTRFEVVGIVERWVGINAGTPAARQVPGGTCWHCGTGIAYCVQIRNLETSVVHEIGTTCAERVGLDKTELKAMLAEKYAQERLERSAAYRREQERKWRWRDAVETRWFGAHGTVSRWTSGCRCDDCTPAAPHGTVDRFHLGCRGPECIDAILSSDQAYNRSERHTGYRVRELPVIVDLRTGEVVEARRVDTRYGYRWCVRDGLCWLPVEPARRATQAKKGYVEAETPFLVNTIRVRQERRHDWWDKPVCRLGSPYRDHWGEVIPRPEAQR